jgi:hypothetical protein
MAASDLLRAAIEETAFAVVIGQPYRALVTLLRLPTTNHTQQIRSSGIEKATALKAATVQKIVRQCQHSGWTYRGHISRRFD